LNYYSIKCIKVVGKEYILNWKEHVDRMSSDRIPKMIQKYQPKGKRNLGGSLKR
jgi:hypothetical protein